MADYVLGKDCKAYLGSTLATSNTDFDTPRAAATLLSTIKNLKLNLNTNKADVSTRGSGGWTNEAITTKVASITFDLQYKLGDTQFAALRTAYLNSSEVFFDALDGLAATTGSQGIAGNWTVASFTRNEDLNGAVTADVELIPSSYTGWDIV